MAPDNRGHHPELHAPPSGSVVDDIIATEKLYSRVSRPADFKAENEALAALIETLSQTPELILQKLADTALSLCHAESSGISIAEADGGEEIFRWHATAGKYTQYLGGTMPRHFSPCGIVIDRNEPILMVNMVQHYAYVSSLEAPPHEVLLVPFHMEGKPVGTVWVVAHDSARQFDTEDLRILHSLTRFASMALQTFAKTKALQQANAAAQVTAETREQFIAVLGHDLRNPLAAILNSAKLLERQIPHERVSTLGQIIGKSAYRINELVDNLLDFARGRLGGGIGLRLRAHDTLEPVLNQVVAELRSAYPDRDISIRFAFEVPVHVDADRIAQMISNLVGNALTHGAADTPVELNANSVKDMMVISVSNAGAPISPTVMARLFKPFERGDSDATKSGLGLGLYIASEIARAHGGELTASSSENQTTFRFVLPLYEV